MQSFVKLAALAAVVLVASGCSAPAAEKTDAPSSQTPTVAATSSSQDAFLDAFRKDNPQAARATDDQWLAVADTSCKALAEGASPADVAGTLVESGNMTADESGSLVVLATEHLCTEFAPQ